MIQNNFLYTLMIHIPLALQLVKQIIGFIFIAGFTNSYEKYPSKTLTINFSLLPGALKNCLTILLMLEQNVEMPGWCHHCIDKTLSSWQHILKYCIDFCQIQRNLICNSQCECSNWNAQSKLIHRDKELTISTITKINVIDWIDHFWLCVTVAKSWFIEFCLFFLSADHI